MTQRSDTKVIIVAAGRGSRMGSLAQEQPKCFFEFAGKRLIDWQLTALSAAGLSDVTFVTGYKSELLKSLGHKTRHNPNWADTNMVASLMCARDILESGSSVVVAYADIVYEPRLIQALEGSTAPVATIVDLNWETLWRLRFDDPLFDAETLKMGNQNSIIEIGQKPDGLVDIEAQYIGLTRFSADGARKFVELYDGADSTAIWLGGRPKEKAYFTDFLTGMIGTNLGLSAVPVDGGWLEFDTGRDASQYVSLLHAGNISRFWQPEAVVA